MIAFVSSYSSKTLPQSFNDEAQMGTERVRVATGDDGAEPRGVTMGWAGWAKSRGPRVPGKKIVHVGETFNRFADLGL